MKAPDKIYIPTNAGEAFSSAWTTRPFRDFKNTEYIRKDALIEWAKKNNKRIDSEEGDYSLGYVSAMIDLIEKIESL